MATEHFSKVTFRNYKALKNFRLHLNEFNVLVGPNNAGKSTIIGAFRILAEGIRKAKARRAIPINSEVYKGLGYEVPLENLPVATENIFTDYDDSEPAVIEFELSSGMALRLIFPANDVCYMICDAFGRVIRSPAEFRKSFKVSVGFVPILGPVEHNEVLYQKEAARLALLTHRASRNFRNIWYHYPDEFDEFREMVRATWPGMDIEKPEVDTSYDKPVLHMFCPEGRYPREIFWAGFGFQVWCQMLTYIVRSREDALLIIDEPDIYLHSDLQRQLLEILQQAQPDILIATHSTEIISEVNSSDILVINKSGHVASRIKNPNQLQSVFGVLGSNLNPTLTQLAKTRRSLFIEGKDFQILSAFARKLGFDLLANRADFAVVPVGGFNPSRVHDFAKGMELTLGTEILKGVVFDRDYRSPEEVSYIKIELDKFSDFSYIHGCKEIENYLLVPQAIERAIKTRLKERARRTGKPVSFSLDVIGFLSQIWDGLKSKVQAQFIARRTEFLRKENPSLDDATITQKLLEDFEALWSDQSVRLNMVPGKEFLSTLNNQLQDQYKISLTNKQIVAATKKEEIPQELIELLGNLENFRKLKA